MKLLAILLIVGGILGLVYGGFTYIDGVHSLNLGFTRVTFWDRDRVNIPVWAGVLAIVGGAFMLYGPKRR